MDAQIDPILQKYADRTTQTRIDSHFMTYHDDNRFAKIASERLRNTVIQITGKGTDLSLIPTQSEGVKRKATTSNSNSNDVTKKSKL